MRIRRIRLSLPPRMQATAVNDARAIGKAVAAALANSGTPAGALSISVSGGNRAAVQLRGDLARAVNRAVATRIKRM